MVKRKRLGLIFSVNPKWMGGTYYILNLINTLNYLEDSDKPFITLLCSGKEDYKYAISYCDYPYIDYVKYIRKSNLFARVVNKLSWYIIGKNIISKYKKIRDLDYIFPIREKTSIIPNTVNIGWIPDFQEKYLPHLFSQYELEKRDKVIKDLIDSGIKIIVSSNASKEDFIKFYSVPTQIIGVYNFTSKIPGIVGNKDSILNKYNVRSNEYFLCSNQFWIHKNHRCLFEAIKIVKRKGYNPILLCTGNTTDFRSRDYFSMMESFIIENNLSENIKILGMIDRDEQLILMKNSRAIIQPSLFEGWNTSVEEAKAMNKIMILSDLPVHKEQVTYNGIFFSKGSSEDLAKKIEYVLINNPQTISVDYQDHIIKSAYSFINILS